MTAQVLRNMPMFSTAYIYGDLSQKPYTISPGETVSKMMTIKSFNLLQWLIFLSEEERKEQHDIVIQDIISGGEVF
jgi:hypothetical protein